MSSCANEVALLATVFLQSTMFEMHTCKIIGGYVGVRSRSNMLIM